MVRWWARQEEVAGDLCFFGERIKQRSINSNCPIRFLTWTCIPTGLTWSRSITTAMCESAGWPPRHDPRCVVAMTASLQLARDQLGDAQRLRICTAGLGLKNHFHQVRFSTVKPVEPARTFFQRCTGTDQGVGLDSSISEHLDALGVFATGGTAA